MTETETSFIRPNTRTGDDAAIARNKKTKTLAVFLSTMVLKDTADKPNKPIIPTQDIGRSLYKTKTGCVSGLFLQFERVLDAHHLFGKNLVDLETLFYLRTAVYDR